MPYTEDEIKQANLAKTMEAVKQRKEILQLGTRQPIELASVIRSESGFYAELVRGDGIRVRVDCPDIDPTDELEIARWLKVARKMIKTGQARRH